MLNANVLLIISVTNDYGFHGKQKGIITQRLMLSMHKDPSKESNLSSRYCCDVG